MHSFKTLSFLTIFHFLALTHTICIHTIVKMLLSSLFSFLFDQNPKSVTELTIQSPAMQFSLRSFASSQLVTETTNLLPGAITVMPPFQHWLQRAGPDRQTYLGTTQLI